MARKSKTDEKVVRMRKMLVAFVCVVVGVVVGYGIWTIYLRGDDEMQRYISLEDRPDRTGPIVVTEYFSYACIHCKTIEEQMEGWLEALPSNVRFRRIHVAFNTETTLLAKTHAALLLHDAVDANQSRIFKAIHDRGRRFLNVSDMADYVHGYGIDRAAFRRAFESERVARTVREGREEFNGIGLTGTPAFVVDGKHVIHPALPRGQIFDTIDELIRELTAQRAGQPSALDKPPAPDKPSALDKPPAPEADSAPGETPSMEEPPVAEAPGLEAAVPEEAAAAVEDAPTMEDAPPAEEPSAMEDASPAEDAPSMEDPSPAEQPAPSGDASEPDE